MNEAARKKLQDFNNSNPNKEGSMSGQHAPTDAQVNNAIKVLDKAADAELNKEKINPEATTHRMSATESTTQGEKPAEKESSIALVGRKFREGMEWINEKAIQPTFQFFKGVGTRAWGGIVGLYDKQVAQAKSMGTLKYLLDKAASLLIFTAKLGVGVTLALMISDVIFNYTGLVVFDPFTAAMFALGGIAIVAILSVMNQRDQKAPVEAKVVGQHVMERVIGNGLLCA